MAKLNVFNHVSLDGCFVDARGDMSWAHRSDPEFDAFTAQNARDAGGVMLFGRVTYELMAGFWPTPMAMRAMPEVAAGMNAAQKVVFSRTLKKAAWNNTKLVKRALVPAVKKLKAESKQDLVVLGSGTLVAQLTQAGLVDRYQLIVNPLVLGSGRSLFEGVKGPVQLKLTDTRRFKNGNVLLTYVPR